jgi:hypothetical protein
VTTSLHRINHPCAILYWSAGPPDEHNNQTDVWTTVQTVCSIQERSRLETGGEAEIGVSIWLCFLKPTEQIPTSVDLIQVDGNEYHFHGDGYLARDIRMHPDHIESTCWKAA